MKSIFAAAVIGSVLGAADAEAGEIDLTMSGFAHDRGVARIVLMEGSDGYSGDRPVTLTASVPINGGIARWKGTVPSGTYAIIAHHDRDADGVFDRPVFELPLEPYGYSNGAWTSMGLPPFDVVAFNVGADTAIQRIPMRMNGFVVAAQILAVSLAALAVIFIFAGLRARRLRTA